MIIYSFAHVCLRDLVKTSGSKLFCSEAKQWSHRGLWVRVADTDCFFLRPMCQLINTNLPLYRV